MKGIRGPVSRMLPALLALLAIAVLALVLLPKLLSPVTNVSNRFVMYLEEVRPAGKLVVLTSRQRYTLSRDFSARLLAFIQLKSSVEISVYADVAYYIEVSDPADCRAAWNRRARILSVCLPAPRVLPPAIMTETLEVRTKGANILSETLFRLREAARSMESGLSAELLREATASLENPELREKIRSSVASLAEKFFLSRFGTKPAQVVVKLGEYNI